MTEEEWNKLQSLSSKNVKSTPSGRIYLFTSLMRCPVCGQKLVGTGCSSIINRKTKEKRSYCYYRCNRAIIDHLCSNRHRVSQNLIEDYLLENLENEYKKYQIRYKKIREQKKKLRDTRTPEKLNKELDRLNLLFQKDRITWEYYAAEYDRIEKELKEISTALPEVEKDFTYLEELLRSDFKKIYEQLTPENRRAFWRSTIEEIHLNEDSTVKNVDFL